MAWKSCLSTWTTPCSMGSAAACAAPAAVCSTVHEGAVSDIRDRFNALCCARKDARLRLIQSQASPLLLHTGGVESSLFFCTWNVIMTLFVWLELFVLSPQQKGCLLDVYLKLRLCNCSTAASQRCPLLCTDAMEPQWASILLLDMRHLPQLMQVSSSEHPVTTSQDHGGHAWWKQPGNFWP
jgi:hypothetical protein